MKWCVLHQGARCVAQRLRISMGWFWRLDGWCLGQRAETKSAIALLLPSHCLWSNSHFDPVKLYKVNRRSIKRAKRTNQPNLLLNKPDFGCDRPNLPNFLHQTDLIQWNHIVPISWVIPFIFQQVVIWTVSGSFCWPDCPKRLCLVFRRNLLFYAKLLVGVRRTLGTPSCSHNNLNI